MRSTNSQVAFARWRYSSFLYYIIATIVSLEYFAH
jgi:hypothetical protein